MYVLEKNRERMSVLEVYFKQIFGAPGVYHLTSVQASSWIK